MKLNIGCGNDRRTGWVNIDSSAGSAADKVMPAENLDLSDGCAREIEALHLVEHLGYFRTRYFLSECFRVLRPGGRLVIETPDIIKTCAAFAGARGPEEREAQLGWIYGAETAGMGHRYAFPEELLKELARRAGFDIISTESRTYHPGRAALRFELRRHEEDRAAACLASLRKAVMKAGLEDFSREELSSARDEAVDRACAMTLKGDAAGVLTIAAAPAVARLAIELMGEAAKKESVAASLLAHCGGAALAWRVLFAVQPKGGAQGPAFASAELAYEKAARRALEIDKLEPAAGAADLPPVFSRGAARAEGERLLGRALKAAGAGEEDAGEIFAMALSFERDEPRIWLEAGRYFKAAKGKAEAADYFMNGLLALEGLPGMETRDAMRRELMKELG
ncbi:MAG: hypothetical protein FD189_638 [Elusimicrobia bacterium]|nr:MAG: hypothetical protein FD154_636 [Elusimicrobiota bacterium]KAF0157370.1 MAG: hypothetical protein FD189_638 [Elusimicrobiota bacterium]